MDLHNSAAADQTEELRNEDPAFLTNSYESVLQFLANSGWHVLFGVIVLVVAWSYVEPHWSKWKKNREKKLEERELARNPEKVIERQEAMELARQRLQDKYDELAKEHSQKMKEKEELKRQEKLKEWDQLQEGFRSKQRFHESAKLGTESSPAKEKERFRQTNYNPLMGSGSGVCYRPARRSGASGGG